MGVLIVVFGELAAMRDFARAQDKWYPTWPTNPDDRAFRM